LYILNNSSNIDDYDGIESTEKYLLYCNDPHYKNKLHQFAKTEIYNKSKKYIKILILIKS
jgi:hypothetical protein